VRDQLRIATRLPPRLLKREGQIKRSKMPPVRRSNDTLYLQTVADKEQDICKSLHLHDMEIAPDAGIAHPARWRGSSGRIFARHP
jgi:hypothetical protein